MKQERIWELEDDQFSKKLFKNAVFKGGGGGGGQQTTQTVEKADPWSGQQPYLTYGFGEAKRRYQQDQPQFFPGETITPFTAPETQYQQFVTDYTTGGRPQALQAGAEAATQGLFGAGVGGLQRAYDLSGRPILDETQASPVMQQMLSGQVQQNPFIQPAIQAMARDAVGNFQQQVMPALRASQIAYQPGGSSRGDIATGLAAGEVGRSITDAATRMQMGAFESAQQQQMDAARLLEGARGARAQESLGLGQGGLGLGLGAYGTVAQTPIDIMGNLADVGMTQRELQQQQLDEAINRYQFEQNVQDQKLANYMNLIQGNYGGQSVATAERGGLGLAGQLGQVGGTLAALGGLFGG